MSRRKKRLGHAGEKAAAAFLESCGYTLLETGYRSRAFEIDIIARQGDTICFVEVKTRRHTGKGLPREAVTKAKQLKLITGARYYLKQQELYQHRARFDVVEVMADGNAFQFTLIPNAFQGV